MTARYIHSFKNDTLSITVWNSDRKLVQRQTNIKSVRTQAWKTDLERGSNISEVLMYNLQLFFKIPFE